MSFEGFPQTNPDEQLEAGQNPEAKPEHSPEMLKFKGEVEKLTEVVGPLLQELRNRADQGFTEFIDASDLDAMSAIFSALKNVDVYSDHDLEQTNQAITNLCACIDSIGVQPGQKGTNDDPESLKSLAWKLRDVFDQAGELEAVSKQIAESSNFAMEELFQKLKGFAHEKSEYITQRAEALERYLG